MKCLYSIYVLRRPKRDTNIEKTSKNFLTYADHLKTAQMVGVFLLKGGISMELKSIIGIGAVVLVLGGLAFMFIRNRRK